jgi:hypothetical protein
MQNYRHFVCDRLTGPADCKYRLSDACFAAMVEKIIPPLPEAAANGVFNRREYCILPEDLDAYPNKHNRLNAMLHGSDSYGAQLVRHIFADIAAMENLPQTV